MVDGSSAVPTRVVLPMLNLVPGGMGGSETYAREVTRELVGRRELDVTCVVPASAADFCGEARRVVEPHAVEGGSVAARLGGIARGFRPSRQARAAIRNADVVHHLFTLAVPLSGETPRVATLLDVQHHDLSDFFTPAELLFRRVAYDSAARRAVRIITISDFCRSRIIESLGIPPDRVAVAHLGVDTATFVPFDGPREEFVLYPARAWPHKNHARLFEAMGRLRERRPGLRLVLTGGGAEAHGPLPDGIEHRGQVSMEQLLELYRRASALVFPSLYEGFGLPLLEAMASGCPVASATSASLPEICGDAAVMFDATSTDDIARGIGESIDGRSRLVPLGLRRVRRFTWSACADVHVETYLTASKRGRT